jgi:hypothetical protein
MLAQPEMLVIMELEVVRVLQAMLVQTEMLVIMELEQTQAHQETQE